MFQFLEMKIVVLDVIDHKHVQVLTFKTVKSDSTCPSCRKMNKHKCDKVSDNIQNSENPCTESALDNLNTDFKYIKKKPGESEVLLSQEDHTDIKNIFNKVCPQSTDKMKTF